MNQKVKKHNPSLENVMAVESSHKKNKGWLKVIVILITSIFLIFISKLSVFPLWLKITIAIIGVIGCIMFLVKISTLKTGHGNIGWASWWWGG